MYNEEIKKKFLEYYDPEDNKNSELTRFFNKLEAQEVQIGKDAAQMSFEEARQAIISLNVGQVSTLRKMLTTYRKYAAWCMEYGALPDVMDGFGKLKTKDIDLSKSANEELFKDEDEFFWVMKQLYTFDDGIADVPYLALIWAGMKPEEVVQLKDSEIDIDRRIVYNPDGSVMIPTFSDRVCDVLKQYVSCRASERGHHSGVKRVIKDMSVDTFLKKMLTPNSKDFGTSYRETALRTHIRDVFRKCENPNIKIPNSMDVWHSGRYYQLYIIEQSGVDVFSQKSRELVESVFRYEKGYHNAIRMYKEYKKAFNL